jgi:repressor LexA
MPEVKLSVRQEAILEYIERFVSQHGYPPTIREIGKACNISSTSVVNYNLNKLEREGLLLRDKDVSRGLRLAESPVVDNVIGLVRVPLLGKIVASAPAPVPGSDFSYFSQEDTIELTADVVAPNEKLFALRVEGESMIDAMINDGDVVILRPHEDVRDGDLVAVWLKDREETTLKHIYREKGRIRLQPANPTMGPIYIDNPEQVQVQGKVVAVVRQLN